MLQAEKASFYGQDVECCRLKGRAFMVQRLNVVGQEVKNAVLMMKP